MQKQTTKKKKQQQNRGPQFVNGEVAGLLDNQPEAIFFQVKL